MWVDTADLPTSDGHPFFERLNRVLEEAVPVLDQRRGVLFAASRRGEEASHQPSGLRQQGCEPFAPALAEESDERGGANRTSHGARSRSSWMRAPVS